MNLKNNYVELKTPDQKFSLSHLNDPKTLENVNQCIITVTRSVVAWVAGAGRKKKYKTGGRNFWVDRYFHDLDCVGGFTVAYIGENFQIIHFKYVQFIAYKLFLNKDAF